MKAIEPLDNTDGLWMGGGFNALVKYTQVNCEMPAYRRVGNIMDHFTISILKANIINQLVNEERFHIVSLNAGDEVLFR